MNKKKIVKELDEYIKNNNNSFKVREDFDGHLSLESINSQWLICSFFNFDKNNFKFRTVGGSYKSYSKNCGDAIRTGIIEKFYTKGIELLAKAENTDKNKSLKHRKLLAIRALEDLLIGDLRVNEYKECSGKIEFELEKASEEK